MYERERQKKEIIRCACKKKKKNNQNKFFAVTETKWIKDGKNCTHTQPKQVNDAIKQKCSL